jgi:hypothetical protein
MASSLSQGQGEKTMDEFREDEHNEGMTELMSLALDGLLGPDDQSRLRLHLARCPDCQTEWEAMQQVAALLGRDPMVGPPLGFSIRVERRLNEKSRMRRRAFGGLAVLSSSLSLAGATVAAAMFLVLGLLAWQHYRPSPEVQQSTGAISQVAAGMGLVGRGASLFLKDLLIQYGPPLVLLLGVGLVFLVGLWTWLLVKRSGNSHHNGYV